MKMSKIIYKESNMRNKLILLLSIVMMIFAVGCGEVEEPQPPNLIGTWQQTDGAQFLGVAIALVNDTTIRIYEVSDDGLTQTLYWSGSFEAPTTADEPYVWTSIANLDETYTSIYANHSESKEFTFENDRIIYNTSWMGTTTTVVMNKTSNEVPE